MRMIPSIFAAALVATACVSNYKNVTVKATPRAVADIAGRDFTKLTLTDGSTLEMRPPRDFGEAWCSDNGCARKNEIATIEYVQSSADVGSTLLMWTVGVPAVAVLTGVLCANGQLGCFSSDNGQGPPMATHEQLSRVWLDNLIIEDGRYLGRKNHENSCKNGYGDALSRTFANDAEALDAIWNNRHHESSSCLYQASEGLRLRGADSRDRAMRLWALYQVKWRWDTRRCLPDQRGWMGVSDPIGPSDNYDLKPKKGDPALLRIIEETLADPQSYIDNAKVADCSRGARPVEEWPAAMDRVKSLGPFGRKAPAAD